MDPVAKRISGLRSLVAVMLGVAAGIVGVVSYMGLSLIEGSSAKYRFTSTVEAAVSKLDEDFKNMDNGIRLLAQTYVEKNPSLSDWPTVALPNYYTDSGTLTKDISGADTIAFVPLVKPDDLSRYEAFMFNYWDNDPSILAAGGGGGYYSAEGDRGIWSLNDTANGFPVTSSLTYHDTSGSTSWGEGKRILPVTQALFKDNLEPNILGWNVYSDKEQGEAADRLVQCVEDSDWKTATQKCGATVRIAASSPTRDFLRKTDTELEYVQSHRSVALVVENGGSHEFVGMVGAQYSWGHLLSRIFADDISGIDIVVQYHGFTFTCRIKEGVAEIVGGSQAEGYGDVASKKYAQYKQYVANAHQSSQLQIETDEQYNLEMTFYPTDDFIKNYRTNLPIYVACAGVLLILLVSLVFVGYDVAVRGKLVSSEIVLDTKRRFVRFVSHEIRTPMNAVRLGMTLFSTEIDNFIAKLAGKPLEEVMEVLQTIVADWKKIAVDVLDNTEAAVDVLNDLLNYDKIESGTLQLEFSMVPVWNALQRTFKTFVLQAREKEIVFQLQGEMFGADASLLVGDLGNLHCVGDETRITQVLFTFPYTYWR
ncbi:hypothetical protein B484DRAFT_75574 [Ochromonadaceae sp. CCMP2298]|nr:hypothetical protein B484DRAFT_75574 [Ochromonadaceae sp. CCMP2298]